MGVDVELYFEQINDLEFESDSGSADCYAFNYEMILTCKIDGQDFEFHKTFSSPVQFRVGDYVYVSGLEEVSVTKVVWYLDKPGNAFIELAEQDCGGIVEDWACILDDMDFVVPSLTA